MDARAWAVGRYTGVTIAAFVASIAASIPVYLVFGDAVLDTAAGFTAVFVASCVFGWVYARIDNLVVPSVDHGLFNAIQIGLLYLFVSAELTIDEVAVVVGL